MRPEPGTAIRSASRWAFTGTGYNPNSSIDITFAYVTPDAGSGTDPDAVTSDAVGAWSLGYYENCLFDDGVVLGARCGRT